MKDKGDQIVKKAVEDIAKLLEEKENGYVKEMVNSMVAQADIIARARKDGIAIEKIMGKIKDAYMQLIKK
jgi:hypothetical protein